MILLNGMVRTGRFSEFVDETVKIYNAEVEDETMWEYWLHRIYDKNFSDFRSEAGTSKKDTVPNAPNQEEIQVTITESMEMLQGFCPS